MDEIRSNVLKASTTSIESSEVKGYDFNKGLDYEALLRSYASTGLQATNFSRAIELINSMLEWRPSEEDISNGMSKDDRCTIFLAFTSNMISSGIREIIRYLVQHKLVAIITTTAGAIEEDFIKCLAPSYIGDFHLKGSELRANGLNRIGNMLVPNTNYCLFEEWIMPILDKMREEQKEGTLWTPSKMIRRLGLEINNEESYLYWAAKNDIPIMCPGITDGSIGDMLYMHGYNSHSIILDIAGDIRVINDLSFASKRSGMVILGGGLPKHHTCNANMIRNGADWAVYINTGLEHEGSDSGASPDEAVSWGKIKGTALPVKLFSEASLVFPLIVAETFVKYKLRQDKI